MKGPLWAGVFLAGPFFLPGLGTADFGAGVVGIFFVLFAGGQYSNDSRITGDVGGSGLPRPKKDKDNYRLDFFWPPETQNSVHNFFCIFLLCSRYLED